jgi:hypothetical protein
MSKRSAPPTAPERSGLCSTSEGRPPPRSDPLPSPAVAAPAPAADVRPPPRQFAQSAAGASREAASSSTQQGQPRQTSASPSWSAVVQGGNSMPASAPPLATAPLPVAQQPRPASDLLANLASLAAALPRSEHAPANSPSIFSPSKKAKDSTAGLPRAKQAAAVLHQVYAPGINEENLTLTYQFSRGPDLRESGTPCEFHQWPQLHEFFNRRFQVPGLTARQFWTCRVPQPLARTDTSFTIRVNPGMATKEVARMNYYTGLALITKGHRGLWAQLEKQWAEARMHELFVPTTTGAPSTLDQCYAELLEFDRGRKATLRWLMEARRIAPASVAGSSSSAAGPAAAPAAPTGAAGSEGASSSSVCPPSAGPPACAPPATHPGGSEATAGPDGASAGSAAAASPPAAAGPVAPLARYNYELSDRDIDAVDDESVAFGAACPDLVRLDGPAYVKAFLSWMRNRLPPAGGSATFPLAPGERMFYDAIVRVAKAKGAEAQLVNAAKAMLKRDDAWREHAESNAPPMPHPMP